MSILVPARDEAHRIAPTIRSLLAQTGLADLEILVLDDGSTDGTADVVAAAAECDPRVRLLPGTPPPQGLLGKPHACAQFAAAARGRCWSSSTPTSCSRRTPSRRRSRCCAGRRPLDLLSPWPRQLAAGRGRRLVQPLLPWSWLVSLPLRLAERSRRPSMAPPTGSSCVIEAAALARAGGWQAVAGAVLDDIAVARVIRAAGGRTGIADGSTLATCRMYDERAGTAGGIPQVAVGGVRVPRRRGGRRGGARAGLRPARGRRGAGSRVGALGYAGRRDRPGCRRAGGVAGASTRSPTPFRSSPCWRCWRRPGRAGCGARCSGRAAPV